MDTNGLKQDHINEMATKALRKHELMSELESVNKRIDELSYIISTIEHIEGMQNDKANEPGEDNTA